MIKIFNLIKKLFKLHFAFIILIPLVFVSQAYLLSPHLKYSFTDVDDGSIAFFINLKREYPNPFEFVIKSYYEWPTLYLHQYYYVGVLNYFLGNNFVDYHQATHFFKALASLSTYPLYFVLSGSGLIAFISSTLFAISYSTTGDLQDLVTGGDYLAICTMSIFLAIYFHLIKKGGVSKIFPLYPLALILLILTFIISTARTYPLIIIILLTEIFISFKNRSGYKLGFSIKRAIFFLLPILLGVVLTSFMFQNITERISTVLNLTNQYNFSGKYNAFFLIPFTAFVSTILPTHTWPSYTFYLLFFLTPILAFLLSKHPTRFVIITFIMWGLGIVLAYISTDKTHYSEYLNSESPIAFYILGASLSLFLDWLVNKNQLYIGLFLGPFFSFIFIFGMWFGTHERNLLFFNMHRYLTISTVFINFFIGTFLVILFTKLHKSIFKIFAYLPFLFILIYFVISAKEINHFFDAQVQPGKSFEEKNYMRQQLLPYYQNLSVENPRLIYIDKDTDIVNKNYYEETILTGYRGDGNTGWPGWWPQVNFRRDILPPIITDYNHLKFAIVTKDNIKGILFEDKFFNPKDFFALRLINRKVFDITDQVKKDLDLF